MEDVNPNYHQNRFHNSTTILPESYPITMEWILFSTAIQNCKFNQKCTSAHYIEPAHPLERLRSILIPEQPISLRYFPI